MTRLFAFLRAINVGGRVVTMAALRGHFAALGFTAVESFIASGNVIFTTRARDTAALTGKIEAHLHKVLGYEVHTFLRTETELAAVARARPFSARRLETARAFCVGFMAAPLSPAAARAVVALGTDIDAFHVDGREIYWLCLKGQSESKFTNNFLEKTIGGRATFRNMTTVTKLVARHLKD